jgi:hypothetical protein
MVIDQLGPVIAPTLIDNACAESNISMLRANINGYTLKMHQFNDVCVCVMIIDVSRPLLCTW